MSAPTPVLLVHFGHDVVRGSERVLLDLLRHVDRDRWQPLVWCNSPVMAEAVREIGTDVRVSPMAIQWDWERPGFHRAEYAALVRAGHDAVRDHGARVVHANSAAPCQWMAPVARRRRLPLLAHLHGVYHPRDRCLLHVHLATRIVGCTDAVLAGFRADGVPDDRLQCIPNGVDVERLERGDARDVRASLRIALDEPVIVAVGALVGIKGYDALLHAIARLAARGERGTLILCGDGAEREPLRALRASLGLEDRVHLLGPRPDIGAIFRDVADIVAVPSREESFGLVVAEAAVFGVPAVATRVGGLPEVIEDGRTGLLVPLDDIEALADALGRLAGDAALRARMGDAARARALARYTSERMTRQVEEAWTALLAAPPATLGWSAARPPVGPWMRAIAGLARGALARRLRAARGAPQGASETR